MNLILSYEEILNKFNYDLINKLRKHGSEVNYLNLWVPDEDFVRSFESLVESIKASKISCFTLKVNKNILSNSLIKKFKKKFPNLLISEKENICLIYIKNTNSISFKKKIIDRVKNKVQSKIDYRYGSLDFQKNKKKIQRIFFKFLY